MRKLFTTLILMLVLLLGGISGNAQTPTAPSIGNGSESNPYQITSLDNLYWIAHEISIQPLDDGTYFTGLYFKQMNDIDASATSTWFSGAGWLPIGFNDESTNHYKDFGGYYDGQGYTISNLYINRPSESSIGFFGSITDGYVKNLGLKNLTINANSSVGGLVGYWYCSSNYTIENCYTTGTIACSGSNIGGLIGVNDGSSGAANIIKHCYSECSTSGLSYVAGLVGNESGSSIQIKNCYATGNVSSTAESALTGGLVGYAYGSISQSYATGSVTNSNGFGCGGLIGTNYSNVDNCFATGTVTGKTYAAGFVGSNGSGSTISNCYSTGSVIANTASGDYAGGFVGANVGIISYSFTTSSVTGIVTHQGAFVGFNSTSSIINNTCFWNTSISSIGCGYTNGGTFSAVGKTSAELKNISTFTNSGWDFAGETTNGSNDYWTINSPRNDGYPYLSWQIFTVTWDGTAWSPSAPTTKDNAIINGDYSGSGFACNNLTINAGKQVTISSGTLAVGGNLTLKSDASSTASLIGTTTVAGTTYAERYLTANKWHIVSPIAATQTVAAFLTANTIIPTKTGTPDKRGMMDYNTSTNSWNDYYPATGASGNMEAGKGYSARVASSGTLTFTGTLTSGDKTVALTKASDDNSWNCIGNPYTSAINLNATAHATNNFITQNAGILDASYACIYIWDEDATYTGQNCYKIISNSGFSLPGKTNISQNYVAPGQGFFVKARTNGTNITFTSAMQTHQPIVAFKSAEISWPGIELTASSGDVKASAVVTFNEMMTKGLDPTYDAGLLRSSSGLSVYTRLVDDNGVDFAIQCLPEKGMESYVIPIGLDSKAGGEIKFSAATVGLPTGSSVILEDRTAKIFTNLSNGGVYAVTVSANSSGTGRFYIHTSNLTTGTSGLLPTEGFSLKAYPADGVIWIDGQASGSAKAYLFNIGGSKLGEFNLQEGNRNSIPASGLVTGVYLLKVTDGCKLYNTKIVIRQ